MGQPYYKILYINVKKDELDIYRLMWKDLGLML